MAADIKEKRPIWPDQHPTEPLTPDELVKFEGLTWVNQRVRSMEFPEPDFGVVEVVIGSPDHITMITPTNDGQLVKRIIPESHEFYKALGGGPFVPERLVYLNDSYVAYGPANIFSLQRRITFQENIQLDSQAIQAAIDLTEEVRTAIDQDLTSRKVNQAQVDLINSFLNPGIEPLKREVLKQEIMTKLQEAAVESGLVTSARETLPERIRALADQMIEKGIKCVTLYHNLTTFWPDSIKKTWVAESDGWTWNEWKDQRPYKSLSGK